MNPLKRLDGFHKTKRGYLVFAVVELVAAYIFISIALDTANMWAYLAGVVLSIGTILNFINVFTAKDAKKRKADAPGRR